MEEQGEWFRETLIKIDFVYKLCGLRLFKIGTNQIKAHGMFLFTFLNANSELAATTAYFINGLITRKNYITVIYNAPCVLFSYMTNFKILLHFMYEENLKQKLIEQILEIEENSKHYIDLHDRKEIIGSDVQFLHRLIKLQKIMNLIMFMGFCIAPLTLIAIKYFKTGEIELMLPYFALYPFDAFDRKIWPFIYIHQIVVSVIILAYGFAPDAFLYICCTYINIQFKLLQHEIQKIIPSSNSNDSKSLQRILASDFLEKTKKLIKWHHDLIRSVEMLEIIYAKSTLFTFASSSASICLTLFNVTVSKNVAYILTFMSFLSLVLLQIFFLCYYGDKISEASVAVSDAVYDSLWYLGDSSVGKQLFFIQIRSQRPCKLTAYGFADVNLRAFMRILRHAWSYFALLETMYH